MENNSGAHKIIEKLSSLTHDEFLGFGSGGIAYVTSKPLHDDKVIYVLNNADGSHIATGQDMSHIQKIAYEYQLIPMTVH